MLQLYPAEEEGRERRGGGKEGGMEGEWEGGEEVIEWEGGSGRREGVDFV